MIYRQAFSLVYLTRSPLSPSSQTLFFSPTSHSRIFSTLTAFWTRAPYSVQYAGFIFLPVDLQAESSPSRLETCRNLLVAASITGARVETWQTPKWKMSRYQVIHTDLNTDHKLMCFSVRHFVYQLALLIIKIKR